MLSPSRIEISRENLLHNISEFKKLLSQHHKIVAVLKANAYDHDSKLVAKVIEEHVDYFQVDDVLELKDLRTVTTKPALVLGYVPKEEIEEAINLGGILTVYDDWQLEEINRVGEDRGQSIDIQIEVDSFLGRLGVTTDKAQEFIIKAQTFKNIKIDSLYAHFSDIEDTENLEHARRQKEGIAEISKQSGIPYHISATSGILAGAEDNWGGDMLRLGVGLYGLWPSYALEEKWKGKVELKPVMQWKTEIAQVKTLPADYPVGYGRTFITDRETKVAIIPQGYSDGFDRRFSNNGKVLIGGEFCPVLGRVSMNMFVVDVSHIENVKVGDEVVIIGKQGQKKIGAEELAEGIGRINYEIVTRISPLLPRILV